ncbi:hypothetical protein KGA66_26335 [Actinocrinis puniceicyclus]|uniref:Uncharacterized protein n=1 Tax=Actinocrinis puniceicyclus TaxID=977794 RepID=A0A8J7WUX4_9ACTN|nr:hypothetical protein [Actinocrinis puniceicyclus]MBS2966584.1 hypothetical protein [Actinocrinis puniceicyclus]
MPQPNNPRRRATANPDRDARPDRVDAEPGMHATADLNEGHLALARLVDALFCSDLETGSTPTHRQLAAAIRGALQNRRGWNGRTRAVAEAFTRNPREAEMRELWCQQLAEIALGGAGASLEPDGIG